MFRYFFLRLVVGLFGDEVVHNKLEILLAKYAG